MTDATNVIAFVTNMQDSRYFVFWDWWCWQQRYFPIYSTKDGLDVIRTCTVTMNTFFALDDDGTKQDWDTSDFVKVQ